jgi:hypothetical protein
MLAALSCEVVLELSGGSTAHSGLYVGLGGGGRPVGMWYGFFGRALRTGVL